MFSRHCVRVQIRSGGNSLTFTTSLTGWAFWTLKYGERTAESTRSVWARESARFLTRGRRVWSWFLREAGQRECHDLFGLRIKPHIPTQPP